MFKVKWRKERKVKNTIGYANKDQAEFMAETIRQSGYEVLDVYLDYDSAQQMAAMWP